MTNTKPAWASKTVWGLIIAVVPLLKYLGIEINIADLVAIGDITNELYMVAVQLVGLIIAFYGRMVAKTSLS